MICYHDIMIQFGILLDIKPVFLFGIMNFNMDLYQTVCDKTVNDST